MEKDRSVEEISCAIDRLTSETQNQLESLLLEFDQSWTTEKLEQAVAALPGDGSLFHQVALVELAKIDMEHCWLLGSRRTAEDYQFLFPRSDAGAMAELLAAEYVVRLQFGEPVSVEELAARFPDQADRLAQLVELELEEESSTSSQHGSEVSELVETLPLNSATASEFSIVPTGATVDGEQPASFEQDGTHLFGPGSARDAAGGVLSGQLGRYEILKRLGQGAMGAVYLARDLELGREVALKVPLFHGHPSEELLKRFRQEAKAAARLQHAGICPVYDVVHISGRDFISMACIRGQSLKEYLHQHQPVAVSRAVEIIRRIALAMEHAHSRGVVHRDLKPANVMLNEQGEPLVMDFGLALLLHEGDESVLTQHGRLLGTPVYMSPEQLEPEKNLVSEQTDVYSLGVILYQMLSGELPFQGSFASVVAKIMTQDPQPVNRRRLELDPRLAAICHRMMARELDARYASMQQVADDLGRWLKEADAAGLARESDAATEDVAPAGTGPQEQSAADSCAHSAPTAKSARTRWRGAGAFAAVAAAVLGLVLTFPALYRSPREGVWQEREQPELSTVGVPGQAAAVNAPTLAIAPFDAQQARQHQQAWAQHLGVPVEKEIELPGGVTLAMVLIPPGEFLMGSLASDMESGRDEQPRHPVQISRPYYLGKYEITQAQWQAVMGTAPWKGQMNVSPGDEYAATFITWEDAQAFCHELNDEDNGKYRLPTEAEWEYACRAGSNTRFHFADEVGRLGDYAWFNLNAGDIGLAYAHEVGRKQPNPWSLYDMHGNVREWCYDFYVSYDHGQPASGKLIDPQEMASESRFRVNRGGGWQRSADFCRCACRGRRSPIHGHHSLGFRLAASLQAETGRVDEVSNPAPGPAVAAGAPPPLSREPVAIRGGNWFLEGEELVQSEAVFGMILFGDRSWTDYDLTLETLTVSAGVGSEGARNIFRATSLGDLYSFTLGCYGGAWIEAMYLEAGQWGRDDTLQKLRHETGRWYKVHVRVRGSQVTCWLDGELIFGFRKELHPAGCIGLGTWDSPVRWRNLKVTDPDGRLLWEGFPDLPDSKLPESKQPE